MRRYYFVLAGVAFLLVLVSATVIWWFARLPLQPAHITIAQVQTILPMQGRWDANRDRIFLRGEHAFGQFDLLYSDDRCKVGQNVRVQQRGITLTPLPSTCRS